MKNYLPIFIAILILAWGESTPLSAQFVYPPGPQFAPMPAYRAGPLFPTATMGMFGYRQVGGPSYPVATTGMFGDRIIGGPSYGTVSSGMFGTRFIGPAWNSYNLGIQNTPAGTLLYGPPSNSALLSPPYAQTNLAGAETAINNMNYPGTAEELPMAAEAAPQPIPPQAAPAGTEGAAPVQQVPAAAAGTPNTQTPATPAAPTVTSSPFPRGWIFAGTSLPPGRAPAYVRSAPLSDRLTQIARDRDMLVGQRIEVSLFGNIALIQGTVRTSADSTALANVLSLEPQVQRIDNRLNTEENRVNMRSRQNR